MADARQLRHQGFDLSLSTGFPAEQAVGIVDRALAESRRRVQFEIPSVPLGPSESARCAGAYVKAEFRALLDRPSRRLHPPRALSEAAGYEAFHGADLPAPRVLFFGAQSPWRPTTGSIICTERVRGRNGARSYAKRPDPEVGRRMAALLGRIHGRGLVHGDAMIRNFVLSQAAAFAIDLPRAGEYTSEAGQKDLSDLIASLRVQGATDEHCALALDAYAAEPESPAEHLGEDWRARVREQAAATEAFQRARATGVSRRTLKKRARRARRS